MKKVAVFGRPGSGKSTLSKALASASGLPLYALDSLVYQANGERVARAIFDEAHAGILASERWIIEGFGPLAAFHQRLETADTLVYVDLPYLASYWFVTKRLLKGLFVKPEGWPEGSSVLKGTLESYKVLRLSPAFWNEAFLSRLKTLSTGKTLHVINSVAELDHFVREHFR
ncbi:MAG: shikimate kinase [Alcanivorax sediminis]|uniref:shikimate kinase n=1 Tax=Alcanivorax sediminis TaxID=2663008 RepID=UPI003C3C73F9